jgi:hypothetical protein
MTEELHNSPLLQAEQLIHAHSALQVAAAAAAASTNHPHRHKAKQVRRCQNYTHTQTTKRAAADVLIGYNATQVCSPQGFHLLIFWWQQ